MLDFKLKAAAGNSMCIEYYNVEKKPDELTKKNYKIFSSNYVGKIIYLVENEISIYTSFIFIAKPYRGKGILNKMMTILYSLNPDAKKVYLDVKEEMLRKGKLVDHYKNLGFKILVDTYSNIKLGNMTYRMIKMKKKLTEKDFDTGLFFHDHF